MNEENDGTLLRAFRTRGDEAAFAELLRRHGGIVLAAARSVVGTATAAEDVGQAAFLTLARKAAAFEADQSVAGWLHHVAICLARDERRQERRRRAREEEAAMLAVEPDRSPELSAAALAVLHEELGSLSDKHRLPLVLHHLEGLSYAAAAARCGCNDKTFSTRLTRAREKLRQRLVARGVTLGADGVTGVLDESATSVVLPAALVAATCQAASLVAAGKTLSGTGLVSAQVAYLTKSALKTLFWAKVKTAALATAASLAVVAGGGLAVHQALAHQARVTPPPTVAAPVTAGMVAIPGGTNAGTDPDGNTYRLTVDRPFLMDRCEVSKALWDEVKIWSDTNGYRYDNSGSGKAANHPVHSVSWFDCLKWCNARSEKDGFKPVYYTDPTGTNVFRTKPGGTPLPGGIPLVYAPRSVTGYRLPTIEEWQYAARGGEASHRFPWHDTETIQHSRANYTALADQGDAGRPFHAWDTSPTPGCHPLYAVGPKPYTSPVGAFASNAYGVCDMIGNVAEWCADGALTPGALDFRSVADRALCGGSWAREALPLVRAVRWEVLLRASPEVGFRTVRTVEVGSSQPQ